MPIYNPNDRLTQQEAACSPASGNCGPADCGPFPGTDPNCCPPIGIQRNVCPVEVFVPGCEPGYDIPLNGSFPCDCVPCLDEIAFTDEQKLAIQGIIEGIMKNLSPYAYACCQVVDPIGHHYPLAPRPTFDEDGNRIYELISDPSITITQTEYNALIPDAQALYQKAFDTCCDVPVHSAFVNSGMSVYGAMGYTGYNHAPISKIDSIEGAEKFGKFMCCVLDKVYGAPTLELTTFP